MKVLDFGLAKAMDELADSSLEPARLDVADVVARGDTRRRDHGHGRPTWRRNRPRARAPTADPTSGRSASCSTSCSRAADVRRRHGPETLASVMKDQVTLEKLPEDTPSAIRKLLARCLERDPRRRLQSIGEARIVIEDVIAGVTADERSATGRDARAIGEVAVWRRCPWGAGRHVRAGMDMVRVRRLGSGGHALHGESAGGHALTFTSPNATQMAVSPDGRFVAFVADELGAPARSGCARSTRWARNVSIAPKARRCRSGRRIRSTSAISPTAS